MKKLQVEKVNSDYITYGIGNTKKVAATENKMKKYTLSNEPDGGDNAGVSTSGMLSPVIKMYKLKIAGPKPSKF